MKKINAFLAIGAFLVVAAVLSRAYAYPALAVVPANLNSLVIAQNPPGEPATYFSIPDLAEKTAELGNQSKARANPQESKKASQDLGRDVVVVELLGCTDLVTVDCAKKRFALSSAISKLALDPATGEPVKWDGAEVTTGGKTESGVDYQGLTIKFPFNSQKQTYRFWNGDLRRSVPVTFDGQTSVDGLKAYRYLGQLKPTVLGQVDVPGSVVNRPEPTVTIDRVASSRTTYVVEPESGVILSATSRLDSYATLDGERVLTLTNGTFTTPADAAADAVQTYKPLSKALLALRLIVPIAGGVLGGIMVVTGLILLVRRRRSGPATPRAEGAHTRVHADA